MIFKSGERVRRTGHSEKIPIGDDMAHCVKEKIYTVKCASESNCLTLKEISGIWHGDYFERCDDYQYNLKTLREIF